MLVQYDIEKEERILDEAVKALPREWFVHNEWRLLAQGLGDLLFIGVMCWVALQIESVLLVFPVWVLIAARLHALGVLMHDLGHHLELLKKPWRRHLLDLVICYPISCNVDFFAYAHDLHHKHSNLPGKDPYFLPLADWSVAGFLLATFYATCWIPLWTAGRLIFWPFTLLSKELKRIHIESCSLFAPAPIMGNSLMSPHVYGPIPLIGPKTFPLAPWLWKTAAGPCLFWYTVAAILTWNGWWGEFIWCYWIPLVVMQPIFFWRLMSDHTANVARDPSMPEQMNGITNMDVPWWQSFLIGPHSATYHGFHHLVPEIPNWFWEPAHRRLMESGSEVYRASAVGDYFDVFSLMMEVHRQRSREGDAHETLWVTEEPWTPRWVPPWWGDPVQPAGWSERLRLKSRELVARALEARDEAKRGFRGWLSRRREALRDVEHRFVLWAMHLAGLAALFLWSPSTTDVTLFVAGVVLTGGLGISLGFHRLISHSAFKCPRWVRGLLGFLGVAALEGGPIEWSGVHRRHHEMSDVVGQDPHTPLEGFFHAYLGWIYFTWRKVRAENRQYALDLEEDPYMYWLDKDFMQPFPWLILAVICWKIGGVGGLLWGAVLRTLFVWHMSWCVGSLVHVFGTPRYDTADGSKNIWWLSIIGFGEGWHNNHHAYPGSVFFGHRWWEFDIPAYVALAMERVGLAWDLGNTPPAPRESGPVRLLWGIPTRSIRVFKHQAVGVAIHLLAVAALFVTPTATDLGLLLVGICIGGIGLSLGYHRLFAHRAFECPRWVRRMLAVMGATTLTGGPAFWSGIHRKHHQFSDIPGKDPHSPKDGVFHAHMGWIIENLEGLVEENRRIAADVLEDPFLRWLDRAGNSGVPWLLWALVCAAAGGLSGFLWGAAFRTVFVWHALLSINSVCHMTGHRAYELSDTSANVWWVGLVAFGEGWHNNHHAFPRVGYCAHRWWQVDFAGYFLTFLEVCGLAWSVGRLPENAGELISEGRPFEPRLETRGVASLGGTETPRATG